MNSVELLSACLKMLHAHGYRPTDISTSDGAISITGLEPLPPTPAEEAAEASEYRRNSESKKDMMRVMGLE